MVVALHLPLREPGSYMADGDQVVLRCWFCIIVVCFFD